MKAFSVIRLPRHAGVWNLFDRQVVRQRVLTVASVIALLSLTTCVWSAESIEFNRDVRSILSDKCFACHGPDEGSREADLRLDLREDAVADRGGYRVIAPGEPSESELMTRIASEDDDSMPPPEFGKPLTDDERRILGEWIGQGATWQQHWSLMPLQRPQLPTVSDEQWVNTPIDRFVLARLERDGIRPSPFADRRTLLRRLYFDLTGLPPRAEEVDKFVQDDSSSSYEAAVDRLLASPHYGERMAMVWLDLVRYADTLGYHGDQVRSVSPYRDYTIEAFNNNKPFDQFTIENLAGDLLPNPTLSQRVASTYNRLNRASAEGGVQPKEYLAKYAADRVRTTGGIWLGSTFGCAECHDHKFDPFTTKDFYRFAAFFSDIKEQGIVPGANHIEQLPVPTPAQAEELDRLDVRIASAKKALEVRDTETSALFEQWQKAALQESRRWQRLQPLTAVSSAGAQLTIQTDGAILATGDNPDKDVYEVTVSPTLEIVSAIRLEVLDDPTLPQRGPGRAGNGNFVVQGFQFLVADKPAKWTSVSATHSQDKYGIEKLLKEKTGGWAILPEVGKPHQVIFRPEKPIDLREVSANNEHDSPKLTFVITQNHGAQHTLGKFRLYATSSPNPGDAKAILTGSIEAALRRPNAERSPEQTEALWSHFRNFASEMEPRRTQLAQLRSKQTALKKSITTTLATSAGKPRVMRVLPRGDWMNDSGEIVQPGVPHFLSQPVKQDQRLTRLDLARWITSPDNPLTPRTFVNRLWQLFLGAGISPSVDDLGSQGQWPTHPELLDWMAVEFVESGWDVKHMVKLVVMSNVYRQKSEVRPELKERDPYNRLLARQSQWRLDAEMVRDNALAISRLLVTTVGGPSVRPYQPAGYWAQLNFPKRTYKHDMEESQYRRGLYTHWQRTFLHPSLLAFDAPAREECVARRERSNTPLQALVLLNDPTFVEAARVFAAGILRDGGDDVNGKIAWAFRQALAREPRAQEIETLSRFYRRTLEAYEENTDEAKKLIGTGIAPVPDTLDPTQLAAWTGVARVILNLHETITRY